MMFTSYFRRFIIHSILVILNLTTLMDWLAFAKISIPMHDKEC